MIALDKSATQNLLQSILSHINDAIIVVDDEFKILLFNKAAETIFGCTEESVLNQTLERFIPHTVHAQHQKHLTNYFQHGTTVRAMGGDMEFTVLRANGEEFPAEISVSKTSLHGVTFGVAVIRDVSERVAARKRIEELNKTLEERVIERTQHLIRLNQEKNDFLAIAAHDLRNPLTGIRASAEIVSMYVEKGETAKLQPAKLQRISADILDSASHMTTLIEEMLEVGQIDFVSASLKLNPIETSMIEHICDAYSSRALMKNITVNLEIAKKAPKEFIADSHAFLRVLDNLLSNAVKYSEPNSQVWVNVEARKHEQSRLIRIAIRDSGPGISEEDSKHLFQKFTRLSAKPTGGEPSTGLGLWIVKQLVLVMNGAVWCESALGQGATFIVEFPAA
ncbi:MAG: PAS domain-containing sensor histidine kinase [Candidatus Kapaibacterium sp.]|nr:MAG: PAS domain-containing sensor histidine kinase [Candidatus Kapabacteria bacterium]